MPRTRREAKSVSPLFASPGSTSVPARGAQARDNEAEFRIKAQLARELPWEEDTARWFPLWDIPL